VETADCPKLKMLLVSPGGVNQDRMLKMNTLLSGFGRLTRVALPPGVLMVSRSRPSR
jgi:hypothetical protein